MRYIVWQVTILALAHGAVYAQTEPVWTAISMPYFFDYSTVQQSSQAGSGPYNLQFPANPSPTYDSLGCYWNSYAGSPTGNTASGSNPNPPTAPYWYTGGTENSGPIVRYLDVGVAYEDPVYVDTAVKGISFLGSIASGGVSGGSYGPPEGAVYWSSDPCADGTTEYGFQFPFNNGATSYQFYYSYWSNCVPGSTCYENNGSTPVLACGSGFTIPALPPSTNGQYYFNAFPYQSGSTWEFRVEVLDAGSFDTIYWCDVNPDDPNPFSSCSSPPVAPNINTTSAGGPCTVVPAGNSTVAFNPGWVDEVWGSVFAVIAGGSPSPYVNVGGVETVPMQISVVKVGK